MADSKKFDGNQWVHSLRKQTTATEAIENPLYSDGTAITSYTISGNTVQNGTPTPDNPVMPESTGDKTANLFDGQLQQGYYTYYNGLYVLADAYVCTHLIPCTDNTTYTFRCINTGGGSKNYGYVFFDSTQNRIGDDYIDRSTEEDVVTHTATTPQNTAFLAINIAYGRRQNKVVRPSDITDFMLNLGSTPLPYEPHGYKIPILSAGQTTPVYLGETQSTRKIEKLVLTGEEEWQTYTSVPNTYRLSISNAQSIGNPAICSHFVNSPISEIISGKFTVDSTWIYFRYEDVTDLADFKAYLAAQYAAGTPVTVWYVLGSETTGIVNEPLMKIGDYADTLSNTASIPTAEGANSITVDTTVQPSEFTATWTGWHNASVKEYDGSDWQ